MKKKNSRQGVPTGAGQGFEPFARSERNMRDTGREWAETCKLDGNKHFAKAEWEEAITFYEEGVAAVESMMMNPADDVKVACYSNMAAAYLKLEK